ncbi:osmosensor [Martiniozyma asiatica (nom. inval.)]|nr:osmosensor [Martiniozyma asiatica]
MSILDSINGELELILLSLLCGISWIIAFAACIAATSSSSIIAFPKFTWWGLVFNLIPVVVLPALHWTGMLPRYKQLMLACVTIGFIYASNSTNNFVYYKDGSTGAASAGFILLSMGLAGWALWLGIEDPSDLKLQRNNSRMTNRAIPNSNSIALGTNIHSRSNLNDLNSDNAMEIGGFENPSNVELNEVEYPILVRGLYNYEANADDENELSFVRGELLRVENTSGNWWLAKSQNGKVGMVPSNYLEIVD